MAKKTKKTKKAEKSKKVIKSEPIPPILHGFVCTVCDVEFEAERNDLPCPSCGGIANRIR